MKLKWPAALAVALALSPAMAQDQDIPMGRGARIGDSDNCYQMKQKVLAVSDARTAVVVDPGAHTGNATNASGISARSDRAAHDIVAGDHACAAKDLNQAASYYQHAIDELTSRD